MIRALIDATVAVLLAPDCAACREPLSRPTLSAVCEACWGAIRPLTPPLCGICGDPILSRAGPPRCARCERRPTAISCGRAVGDYAGVLRTLLHALKYDGRRSLAPRLSALMRIHGHVVLTGADLVIPVPLHWRRRWRRGFNQAAELAAGLGVPVVHALRRRRHTRTQTELPAVERQANVRDAFEVRQPRRIANACVVVVDDVTTTGATLEACASALVRAGVGEVRALTVARVATRLPDERRPAHRPSAGPQRRAASADRSPAPDNCP
jgi:ComF family protein